MSQLRLYSLVAVFAFAPIDGADTIAAVTDDIDPTQEHTRQIPRQETFPLAQQQEREPRPAQEREPRPAQQPKEDRPESQPDSIQMQQPKEDRPPPPDTDKKK